MTSRQTVRNFKQLRDAGLATNAESELFKKIEQQFSIAITPQMLDIIRSSDPSGGVAKQFVPDPRELERGANELNDPIGDHLNSPVPGIVHRYPDRVLLNLLHSCAIYCRYCFRREDVGIKGNALSSEQTTEALAYINEDKNIWEVILSGGDPLLLSPTRLGDLKRQLDSIEHIQVLRIHTRIPVVSPDRITIRLIESLKGRLPCYIVIHCNHPDEISEAATTALAKLADAGFPLLSQSVLLAGVNDDLETLTALFKALVQRRVRPYYLHHPDKAVGTAHFRTTIAEGQELISALRGRISGLCQPTYMLDIPEGHGKVPLTPSYIETSVDNIQVRDPNGRKHSYRDI